MISRPRSQYERFLVLGQSRNLTNRINCSWAYVYVKYLYVECLLYVYLSLDQHKDRGALNCPVRSKFIAQTATCRAHQYRLASAIAGRKRKLLKLSQSQAFKIKIAYSVPVYLYICTIWSTVHRVLVRCNRLTVAIDFRIYWNWNNSNNSVYTYIMSTGSGRIRSPRQYWSQATRQRQSRRLHVRLTYWPISSNSVYICSVILLLVVHIGPNRVHTYGFHKVRLIPDNLHVVDN